MSVRLSILLIVTLNAGNTLQDSDNLILKNTCICSGDTVTYECTVIGTYFGNTVWAGSAFNCSLKEIVLQHRLFPENAYGECNTGSIVGRGLYMGNGTSYTSQLKVTVGSDIIGKSIECFYDGNTGGILLVGVMNITLTG